MGGLKEYDVVRVVKFLHTSRDFDGTQGIARPPQVSDIGTIVYQYHPSDPLSPLIIECIDSEGYTVGRLYT